MAKKKILIVDDEADFVLLLKIRLKANGYDTISAANGEEGIDKAIKEKPDLILLDIMMPKKDGYTMLQELRGNEEAASIPVIVVTAKPYMRDLFSIEGIKDYLVKPFEDDDLLLRIKRTLENNG